MTARRRQQTLTIKEPEKIRALRTPARQEILEVLVRIGPCSARELAEETGRARASLYYHIHALVDAGLVRVAAGRRTGRATECLYEPVAKRIMLDRTERSSEFVSALADMHRATIRKAEREALVALDQGRAEHTPPGESVSLLRMTARLRPKAAAKARRMMLELARFIGENDDPNAPGIYAMTTVLVRLHPPRAARGRSEST